MVNSQINHKTYTNHKNIQITQNMKNQHRYKKIKKIKN